MSRLNSLLVVAVAVTLTFPVIAAQPSVEFQMDGVLVSGVRPGTELAWMSFVRVPWGEKMRLQVHYGTDIVTPASQLKIAMAGADRSDSLWAFVAIDDDVAHIQSAPHFQPSTRPIQLSAENGATLFRVVTASVHGMYIRHRGGVWKFEAADGGPADLDGERDGIVTVGLSSLMAVRGNRQAPATANQGDTIVAFDATTYRMTSAEVR